MDVRNVKIPFRLGDVPARNVAAGQKAGAVLSPGRWALSPRSTVPYVEVVQSQYGTRVISWGEVLDVPEDSLGVLANASFHAGDIVMSALGTGMGFDPFKPATIVIPCGFYPNAGGTAFVSQPLDTRGARKAYCYLKGAATGQQAYTVKYFGPTRGAPFGVGTGAATQGFLQYDQNAYGYADAIPLGFGSGQNQETGTSVNSLPETRPMALLDWLTIQIPNPNAIGVAAAADAFFVLEY